MSILSRFSTPPARSAGIFRRALWQRGRVKVRLLRAGKAVILLTLALGGAAVNSGNNVLFLIVGMLLALVALSGVLALLNLRNIEVTLLTPEVLTVGESYPMAIRVHNRRRLPALLIEVFLGSAKTMLPIVPGHSSQIVHLPWAPPQRGRPDWPRLMIGAGFPFSFVWRGWRLPLPEAPWAAPAALDLAVSPSLQPSLEAQAQVIPEDLGEWVGLRDHRSGESVSLVAWRRVDWSLRQASRQQSPLPAHQFSASGQTRVRLDWDDPVIAHMGVENRLAMLRRWLDHAVEGKQAWQLILPAALETGLGRQGRSAALLALASHKPWPVAG